MVAPAKYAGVIAQWPSACRDPAVYILFGWGGWQGTWTAACTFSGHVFLVLQISWQFLMLQMNSCPYPAASFSPLLFSEEFFMWIHAGYIQALDSLSFWHFEWMQTNGKSKTVPEAWWWTGLSWRSSEFIKIIRRQISWRKKIRKFLSQLFICFKPEGARWSCIWLPMGAVFELEHIFKEKHHCKILGDLRGHYNFG